jgi:hypothetical protein
MKDSLQHAFFYSSFLFLSPCKIIFISCIIIEIIKGVTLKKMAEKIGKLFHFFIINI